MIRLSEAALLAYTKLRTRRIRTGITVVVSGLLFAGLIGALIVAAGATQSIASFSKEGLNNRYIVQAQPDPPLQYSVLTNPSVQARAEQLYTQLIADKKSEAKRLGISYDPTSETDPVIKPSGGVTVLHPMLNLQSPAAEQALNEYLQAHPSPGIARLKQVAAPYHPTAYYTATAGDPSDGPLVTMQGGKEDFTDNPETGGSSKDPLQTLPIEKVDPGLTKAFMLPNQPKTYDTAAIPILLPYSKAMQLLGMTALPASAPAGQRLAQIKELYAKAGSITVESCYRNSVSEQQIQTAVTQAEEIAKNAGNKNYQKPDLIYGLPTADSCGQAPVVSDTRTTAEKTADAKQDKFNQMFGQEVTPAQQKLTLRVVGLVPDPGSGSKTTVSGILQDVVGSTLDSAIIIPADMFDALPDAAALNSLLFPTGPAVNLLAFPTSSYYVEFADADDARNFIKDASCTTRSDGTCATAAKPFGLNAYGSNSIALQDLRHKFAHFFALATLAVTAIALVIMGGTVGRMIADGRRETAVFRAVGAKRLDIAAVYTLYTCCLSALVALFSLAAGLLAAHFFDRYFWQSTTVQAQLLFGATDTSRMFHFFALTPEMWLVVLLALACGLTSMLLPLIRNVRRSPIKDMREE